MGEDENGSYEVLGLCLPTSPPPDVTDELEALKKFIMESSGAGSYLSDLYRSSRSIFVSLAMSIVYSIVFIYFLSAFGETLAWICVVILQLGLLAAAGAGWFLWDQNMKYPPAVDTPDARK